MPELPPETPRPSQPTRQYIFSEGLTRLLFVGSGVMMVATLVGILFLASARPQGSFAEPDRRGHLSTLALAAEGLSGELEGTLAIEDAMVRVADEGVGLPVVAQAAPGTDAAQTDPAQTDPVQAEVLEGGELYSANCAACHQAEGQGIPAAFPPLAGHMPELYLAEGGPEYIINVVLNGLQGEIEVLGQSYNGVMTAFRQLSDEQIAAIVNHELTSWGNDALLGDAALLTPEDVAAQREPPRSAAEVLELRPALP